LYRKDAAVITAFVTGVTEVIFLLLPTSKWGERGPPLGTVGSGTMGCSSSTVSGASGAGVVSSLLMEDKEPS